MAPIEQLPAGVIVVTGASRGLGRELVEQLRHQGRPLIAVVRHRGGCSLAPEGEALQLVEADLATIAGIEAAIGGILAALGPRPGWSAPSPGGWSPAAGCSTSRPARPLPLSPGSRSLA